MWWVDRGASGPVTRGVANPLPAFVRAQSELPEQVRTLVLEPRGGRLTYTLLRERDAQFGDVETVPDADLMRDLDDLVAELASGRGSAPVDRLAQYAVQYILAEAPVDPSLEVALDSAPGLLRVSNPGESSLWEVGTETGRMRVVDAEGNAIIVPSEPVDTQVSLPAGAADRLIQMAELSDPGWSAQADGRTLDVRGVNGWAQGFVAPPTAVDVEIAHDNQVRMVLNWVSLVGFLVLIVLALPTLRRERESTV